MQPSAQYVVIRDVCAAHLRSTPLVDSRNLLRATYSIHTTVNAQRTVERGLRIVRA
jgi:hypothetical protein